MNTSWVRFVALPIVGAVFGAVSTAFAWSLLATQLWFPFLTQLRAWHMDAHDVGFTFLAASGVPLVGAMFALMTLVALVVMSVIPSKPILTRVIYMLLLIPGAFLAIGSIVRFAMAQTWSYPLAEVSVLVIGAAWAYFLNGYDAWVRRNA